MLGGSESFYGVGGAHVRTGTGSVKQVKKHNLMEQAVTLWIQMKKIGGGAKRNKCWK